MRFTVPQIVRDKKMGDVLGPLQIEQQLRPRLCLNPPPQS